MTFHLHLPSFPLSGFVENFAYFRDIEPVHDLERFLPDGNTYLVMDLSETPQYIYDSETFKATQVCRRVWFSGVRTRHITIPSGRNREMFVINFRKGRAFPFVNGPMSAFTDYVVDGEQAASPEILTLREKIVELPTVAEKFDFAESRLVQLFSKNFKLNPMVDFALDKIIQPPQLLTVEEVSAKTGYSQKHFIQLFKEHVGLTPKAFLRVMRFQKAVQQIEEQKQIQWTTVAHDCGYYDQAHFINDFKNFSGFTPEQYVQQKGNDINYVPVR